MAQGVKCEALGSILSIAKKEKEKERRRKKKKQ
jgi:hypothetical protein